MKRCAVYELYDGRDTLLYVGMSTNPSKRWREHLESSEWSFGVAHSRIDWFDSVDEARAEEWRRIVAKRPVFNTVGNVDPNDPPHWWLYYLRRKEEAAAMASDERVDIGSAWKMAASFEKAEELRRQLEAMKS